MADVTGRASEADDAVADQADDAGASGGATVTTIGAWADGEAGGAMPPGGPDLDQVRLAWQAGEPVHGQTYFHPLFRAATDAAGCRGYWMGYFGCRAAPLGAVEPATVLSTFYTFAPSMVDRAVPDVWRHVSPAALLEARLAAMDAVFRATFGSASPAGVAAGSIARAAELAGRAAASAVTAGRPLAAANAALPVPSLPELALWQALTVLREHRGDGHLAALVHWEVGPCEALVLAAATGRAEESWLRAARGWTEQEWAASVASLAERGWVEPDGSITAVGAAARSRIEQETDRLAAQPYRVLGAAGLVELTGLLGTLADVVVGQGGFPASNPIGVSWPPRRRVGG